MFQFVLSIVLIACTLIVSRQVDYIQSLNIGYNRENLVYIQIDGELRTKYKLFKDEASKVPGVKTVTRISQSPTSLENSTGGVEWDGKEEGKVQMFSHAAVGYDFAKTMGLQLLDGRDLSSELASDSNNYVVNEKAAALMNMDNPVGQRLTFWGKKGTIVGLVKDFHFESLHSEIEPFIMRVGEQDSYGLVLVRIEAGKTKQALAGLQQTWKSINPKFPFSYEFSDEEFDNLYKGEAVMSRLSNYFAILAITIACLGLLGLAIFTAEQRRREIGIRKVLGASVSSLLQLLSVDFVRLVLIAMFVAAPVAWWGMSTWLADYAYRTNLSWWIFAAAGGLVIVIALATVLTQAVRAALANPVRTLRSE